MDDNYSRRVQYSNGQLLAVEDFRAEQAYHIERRRRHNRLAHTWGILEGLEVEEAAGGMDLVIKPGTAIDKDGQEIVLLGPASEPVGLKDKTSLRGTTFFLGLAYHEKDDPDMEAKDKDGKKIASSRCIELPSIQTPAAAPATDGSVITLAKVTVDATGKVKTIDKSVRSRFAGLNPATDLSVRSLIVGVGVGVTDPKSALSVAGGLAVGANYAKTNAAPPNGLLVEGRVGIGTNDPAANALRVGTGSVRFELGTRQKLSLGGAGSFEIDKPNVVGGRFIVADGGIGIGTTNPTADLQFRDLVANSNVLICRKAAKQHDAGSVPSELQLGTIDSVFAGVRICSERKGTAGNSQYICFETHDAKASHGERMRITSDGNVGIGTTDPKTRLQIGETITHRDTYNFSDSTTLLVRAQDHNGGSKPAATQSVLALVREGVASQAYGNMVDFRLGRWEHAAGYQSRTQLDIYLTEDSFAPKQVMALRANGNVGIGTTAPVSKLHIDKGRVDITTSDITGGGQNRFDGLLGWNAEAAYRRGQLVLSSSYSDLVIASSRANNIHGSTLTLATYNPTDATDYRKWVINQGNWGTRKQFLDFGYSDEKGRANPHDNINGKDTVFTLDGLNKRVGIGTGTPGAKLQIGETITHRDTYNFSDSTTLLVRAKDHNGGSTPAATQSVLALVREGVAAQAYGNMVEFRLGRWEHATTGYPSRTQLDIYLTEDAFVPKHVMSLRANGNVGIGTTDPKSTLSVKGGLAVGASYAGTNGAPDNSLVVEGNVGIGTDNPGNVKLKVIGDSHINGWLYVQKGLVFRDPDDKEWVRVLNIKGGTYPLTGLTLGAGVGPSDLRLKTALCPIRNALEKVLQLNGMYYRWGEVGLKVFTRDIPKSLSAGPNATEEENQKLWETERQEAYEALSGPKIGLIAQDVEAIVPEVVSEDEEGYKYINYQQLIALLIEAIKEQNALLQTLSMKVAALKAVNASAA